MNVAARGAGPYRVYGLCVASDLPIPELEPVSSCDVAPDVHVRFLGDSRGHAAVQHWVFRCERANGQLEWGCAHAPQGYLVRFPDLVDFWIASDGRHIVCCTTALDRGGESIRHLVLDLVMPLSLKLRGHETLHATAVLTPHGMCAFVGPSGSGKSTIAAAFLNTGYPVLCDDCLALSAGDPTLAAAGYPGIRLWSDAFSALAKGERASSLAPQFKLKRRWAHGFGRHLFSAELRPLKRIYRLMWPTADQRPPSQPLEPVPQQEAFMELVAASFRLDVTDRRVLAREFHVFDRLTKSVQMRRLWLTDDLLSKTACEAVLSDVGEDD
jgi:hypothetical protein